MNKRFVNLMTALAILGLLVSGLTPALAAPVSQSGNLILNPEFDSGTTNWSLGLQGGAAATMAVVTNGGLSGTNSLKVTITNSGTATYHVQLNQARGITSGKTYQLSFMAKADAAKTVDLLLQQNVSPYTVYWAQYTINLTTSAATYGPYTFNSTTTDANAVLHFNLASDVDDVWIDKVTMIDMGAATNTPTNTPTRTNTPIPPTNTPTNTPVSGGPYDDEFNVSTLDPKWSWVRPDAANWSLTAAPGFMRITCQTGEINGTNTTAKNILLETAPTGDWTVITKVTGKPNANWAQAGILIYQDDNNWVKVDRLYDTGNQFQFAKEIAGTYTYQNTPDGIASTTSYLKIVKTGTNYSGYYSADGVTYTQVGTTQTVSLSSIKLGLMCYGGTGMNGDFDYIHVTTGASPTATPTRTNTPTPTRTNTPTGGFWPSGVFVNSWTPADYEAFGTWRGRAINVATIWPARQQWADFTSAVQVYTNFTGKPYTMVYGIPLIPEAAGATIAQVAAGTHNQHFRDLGTTLVNTGQGNAIIRLGWEFNGNWYAWAAYDPPTWKVAFQQAVTSIRATAPNVKIDWTVNRGNSQSIPSGNAADAWPGDAYVDIVGVDSYDHWGTWDEQLNGNQGLAYWANFARTHGKQFSVPEWGLVGPTPGNGDNPSYVTNMYNFFNANKDILRYEAYFNCSCAGVVAGIFNPNDEPNASAQYNSLW